MPTVGGWLVDSYRLDPDEERLERYAAMFHRGEDRPWGGRLYLTDRRLIFVPNVIDRFRGGESFTIELLEVADVSAETRESRSEPHLVVVEHDDGGVDRFHLKEPAGVVEEVLEAVTAAASGR